MSLWSNTDAAASKPKNLTSAQKNTVFGVDITEAQTSENQAKGLNTPGWVKYTTYTDAQGATRHKSEVLVAMGTIGEDTEADGIAPDAASGFTISGVDRVYFQSATPMLRMRTSDTTTSKSELEAALTAGALSVSFVAAGTTYTRTFTSAVASGPMSGPTGGAEVALTFTGGDWVGTAPSFNVNIDVTEVTMA